MENILTTLQELLTVYGLNLIAALAIFIIGRWAAKIIRNILETLMTKKALEPTIISFTCNLVYTAIVAFVVIAAISKLGVQTTSFVAVLGAAGLAVGLALQGSLSNFAAGVLLIIFRPFKAGDLIEGAGKTGAVKEISIFTTILTTPDNKVIIIPNSAIMGNTITNYSTMPTRRVDLNIGVSYNDDLKKVRRVLEDLISKDSRILKDPAPMIAVGELADSSVNFTVRLWVESADYWGVYFDTTEAVKLRFDEEGISIPYPQQDVHMYQHQA
ncbi:MAG: mechanosensitive ion channel [Deltaproteobacteria bacterium]|nr:mechanosensitive ion channel [Candidatus Anaeroferrophillus wilburensis]MBN2887956.1 mechanosensitive ion channel [Deltaproteobacteria bacterium]